MNCYIFVKESDDPSISDVRKQVCCDVCQEQVHHSDVEVEDQISDNPEDNNKDETSNDDDQEELSNAGNFQEDSYDTWIMRMIPLVQEIKMR